VAITSASPTKHRLSLSIEPGQLVVTDLPAHDGWRVRATGVEGYETSADGFVAWRATGSGDVERDDARGRHLLSGTRYAQAGGALRSEEEKRRNAGDFSHSAGVVLARRFGCLDQTGRFVRADEQNQRPTPQIGDGAVDGL
jgi:hypothetical protein